METGTELYISEKLAEWSMNIDDFAIGQLVYDVQNRHCKITSKTSNSIEVLHYARGINGIDARQWYDMKQFNKEFKR